MNGGNGASDTAVREFFIEKNEKLKAHLITLHSLKAAQQMLKTSRRTISTTLDSPVVVHVGQPEHVDRDQVLKFLDTFVADKEAQLTVGADADADVHLTSALSQLKRIQRDCQGLPPTVLDERSKQ